MFPHTQFSFQRPIPVDGVTREMRLFQFPSKPLPPYVDLRRYMTPVEDQEDMSTCAANAFAGACEYIIKRRTGRHIDVSRLFIYFNGRMIDQESLDVTDDGASKKNTVLGMRKFGICEEAYWPYDPKLLNQEPSLEAYARASRYTVIPLKVPRNVVAMKTCLANQVPFLIGVRLLPSATREVSENSGYLSKPNVSPQNAQQIGSHAILIVGYDDSTNHFIARNSWGKDWGLDGYFYIPYDYLIEKHLINFRDGLWAIKDIVKRSDHKPTVRRLMVPGHNHDEQRKYDQHRRQMKQLQHMMRTMNLTTMPTSHHLFVGFPRQSMRTRNLF